jgi:integration host factor subunit beta
MRSSRLWRGDQKSVPFFKTGKEMRERLNRDGGAPETAA